MLNPIRIFVGLMLIVAISSGSVWAQNTKGDKPTFSSKSGRAGKIKSKPKRSLNLRNVFNRRVSVHSESRASRAYRNKPMPYSRKNVPDRNRSGKPIQGHEYRVRFSSADVARNNVYPKNYRFNFNPSPKPPNESSRGFSNKQQVARAAAMTSPPRTSGSQRYFPRSNSNPFRTRRKTNANVYWGKQRRGGERSVTTDIAGRPLRTRDFHSANPGIVTEPKAIKRKKFKGDQPYSGSYRSNYVPISPRSSNVGWKGGDISGRPLRKFGSGSGEVAGKNVSVYPRRLSNSGLARNNQPIPTRYPGGGISIFQRFVNRITGRRTYKGGGSNSSGFNNNGQPIPTRSPLFGARLNGGGVNGRGGKVFGQNGLSYTGGIRSRRPLKGGGSISRMFNNNGRPIDVKAPGGGASMGSFSGNLKSRRKLKGGGSNSQMFTNGGRPIGGKAPASGLNMATYSGNIKGIKTFSREGGSFAGNIKTRRAAKGGGSNSGRMFNNGGNPIAVRIPVLSGRMRNYQGDIRGGGKTFSQLGYSYTGSLRLRRAPKGGGSNSGRMFNNGGNPIQVRIPVLAAKMRNYQGDIRGQGKAFSQLGYSYSGDMRMRRKAKGGGSNSAMWNNKGKPILVREVSSQARSVGVFRGDYKPRQLSPGFGYQGELYKGSMKAKAPKKGGGSVSGKLWNNGGNPILTRTPLSADAKDAGYSGRIKLPFFRKKYVRNPNAVKEGLKKARPSKYTEAVGELQVKVKQPDADKNPLSAKKALKTLAPSKNSIKAGEFTGRMKMLWSYTHNPSSDKHALRTIKPTRDFMRGNDYQGRQRMGHYVHNPASAKKALKVLAPGKVVGRIRDYHGNVRMTKAQGHGLHPDSQFAHGYRDNVKRERTFLMNIKLVWSKLFRKNANQPAVVKEKVRRPRYDKKEKELWKDLYD